MGGSFEYLCNFEKKKMFRCVDTLELKYFGVESHRGDLSRFK